MTEISKITESFKAFVAKEVERELRLAGEKEKQFIDFWYGGQENYEASRFHKTGYEPGIGKAGGLVMQEVYSNAKGDSYVRTKSEECGCNCHQNEDW